jgi:N-acetylmuramoyl-L-alanine amidase
VLKRTGIIFCALILLAGCTTTTKWPEEVISSPPTASGNADLTWEDPGFIHPPDAPQPAKSVAAAKTIPPRPDASKSAPSPSAKTWTALNHWTAQEKINAPQLRSTTPFTTYAVRSLNGEMLLGIGSHVATWNGVELLLGFEPLLIDGEIFVHGLDLQKNLAPLLCAPPLTFDGHRVIVIDPGHGGSNSGTKSVLDGRLEKEFTLDWARRLVPLLQANGWQVYLTRTNDADVSLSNRVAFAEAHQADVFISLHFNSAAPDTRQAGLETYCLTPTGMPSTVTRGYDDTVTQTFPDNYFDEQNLQLAERLHRSLLQATGEQDRGVRRARFLGVLRGQKRPAILIEAGYLSNPDEAKRIEDPQFRQKLATATAAALQ